MTHQQDNRKFRFGLWGAAAVVLSAFIVRILFIGRADLWQDEIIFVNIQANPVHGPWHTFREYWHICVSMAQLPMAGVIQNVWMRMAGGAEALRNAGLMRIPGVLFGTGAVLGVYLTARRFMRKPAGVAAVALMALSFFPVYYSREAYCYPVLLFAASFALYLYHGLLFGDHSHIPRRAVLLFLMLWMTAWSHFAGSFYIFALAAGAAYAWLSVRPERKKRVRACGLACIAGGLTAVPYFYRIFTADMPHMVSSSGMSLGLIVNDGVNKLFLGEQPVAAALAWLCLALGVIGVLRSGESRLRGRVLVLVFAVGFGITALAAGRVQYSSARYYCALAPLMMILFAEGLVYAGRLLSRIAGRSRTGDGSTVMYALLIPLLCVHVFLYLPMMYGLKSKSVDFGSIADWLNRHMPKGSPYVMESAYELRFVSGYFRTPDLVAAAPYVHGSGMEEFERLHQMQKEFMERFPVSAFVESVHHNAGSEEGVWTWPHTFYRRHEELRNRPLRGLMKFGIYPVRPYQPVTEYLYVTDIYYNLPEDVPAVDRARGRAVSLAFPGWRCVPFEQHPGGKYNRYARFIPPGQPGIIEAVNLTRRPLIGRFELIGAPLGQGKQATVMLTAERQTPVPLAFPFGRFTGVKTPPMPIPAETERLRLTAPATEGSSGWLLYDMHFHPAESNASNRVSQKTGG